MLDKLPKAINNAMTKSMYSGFKDVLYSSTSVKKKNGVIDKWEVISKTLAEQTKQAKQADSARLSAYSIYNSYVKGIFDKIDVPNFNKAVTDYAKVSLELISQIKDEGKRNEAKRAFQSGKAANEQAFLSNRKGASEYLGAFLRLSQRT